MVQNGTGIGGLQNYIADSCAAMYGPRSYCTIIVSSDVVEDYR